MIKFQKVNKIYKNGHIGLQDVSFSIKAGEFLFLTGHSGAGKSTLMKMLIAAEKPTNGHILLNNQDLTVIKATQIPFLRRQIGVIFQDHQLLFDRTVYENIALPLKIAGFPEYIIEKKVISLLTRLQMKDKLNEKPHNLSTGQQQRVGIARAIIPNPPLLIADEPTGNLDARLAFEVMNILNNINKNGTTVLVATHDLNLVAKMKHRLITLQKGRLIADKGSYENKP